MYTNYGPHGIRVIIITCIRKWIIITGVWYRYVNVIDLQSVLHVCTIIIRVCNCGNCIVLTQHSSKAKIAQFHDSVLAD